LIRTLTGMIPPALIGSAYVSQLRGVSSVLNDEVV
jgi:hypothetical protein